MNYQEFNGVEDIWFWFCGVMITEQSGVRPRYDNKGLPKICEKNTLYKIIKELNQSGILTNKHLRVMSFWGQKFLSPLYQKNAKQTDKQIWIDGLSKLEAVLIQRGYLNAI